MATSDLIVESLEIELGNLYEIKNDEGRTVVLASSNASLNDQCFEGTVVYTTSAFKKIGEHKTNWVIYFFSKYLGSIQLNQE